MDYRSIVGCYGARSTPHSQTTLVDGDTVSSRQMLPVGVTYS